MICLHRTSKSLDRDLKGDIYQDAQPFSEKIKDYLEGNHTMDITTEGSYDFGSAEEVDFNADLPNSHPDIFDVASGQDKVFPEAVVTDGQKSSPVVDSPSETPSTESNS